MSVWLVLDLIGALVAFLGFVEAWRELDRYRGHPVTYKLAKRPVMLWLIILLGIMDRLRWDVWR